MNKQMIRSALAYLMNYKGLGRSFYARELFLNIAPSFTRHISVEVDGLTYYIDTRDLAVGRSLFLDGKFEDTDQLGLVLGILTTLGYASVENTSFLDAGANIGTSSIEAIVRYGFSMAYSFEPEPGTYTLLLQNALANGLSDRIKTFNVALSDTPSRTLLGVDPVNSGGHEVIRQMDRATASELSKQTIFIGTDTIDNLVDRKEISIENLGLVWFDAQGHEPYILKGGGSILASSVPVVCEFWPTALVRQGCLGLMEAIISENYSHFVDLRASSGPSEFHLTPAAGIGELQKSLPPSSNRSTNLLLVKL